MNYNLSESKGSKTGYLSFELEKITQKIFIKSGYKVDTNEHSYIDLIASLENTIYYVEVKSSSSIQYKNHFYFINQIEKMISYSKQNDAIPVLIVYSLLSEKDKEELSVRYQELLVLDIRNILYVIQQTDIRDELISILPFSVEQIEPEKCDLNINWLQHSDSLSALLVRLDKCKSGKDQSTDFENISFDLLKYIFSDDLALWHKQERSNMNLYRFDLFCRIKDYNSKTFWTMMENYFNSKYIVFEFKNYSKKLTQNEIYTTEKYLYQKALRNVAIIIARNGYDNNSMWAAKGCLRESGKLIILLTIEDLKTMCLLKQTDEDPSEFLLNKLDMLLVDLEK